MRSSLRDRRLQPYAGQLFASGQKRVLDGDVRRRGMRALSLLVVEVPPGHFRIGFLADRQPHLRRDALLQVAARGRAAHLRGNPSRIDRVREDVRPEASDGEGKLNHEQF
jgi:hypothetical protein